MADIRCQISDVTHPNPISSNLQSTTGKNLQVIYNPPYCSHNQQPNPHRFCLKIKNKLSIGAIW